MATEHRPSQLAKSFLFQKNQTCRKIPWNLRPSHRVSHWDEKWDSQMRTRPFRIFLRLVEVIIYSQWLSKYLIIFLARLNQIKSNWYIDWKHQDFNHFMLKCLQFWPFSILYFLWSLAAIFKINDPFRICISPYFFIHIRRIIIQFHTVFFVNTVCRNVLRRTF